MNYFEMFGIPVSLKVNKDILRKKFLELSKKNHPDYHINSGVQQKDDALETSADLNKGYKIFSNEDETIKYLLKLKELLIEDEKYSLQPEFLMEMMEINEEAAELAFEMDEEKKEGLLQQLKNIEKEIYEPVAPIIENYKDGVTTEEELLQVKEYYFKKKYLHRLHQQLRGIQ